MTNGDLAHTWDVFCRVVDNLGDAAVCWRLARQLALEHGARVRLWIDNLETLRRLHPEVIALERQTVDGVEVCHWRDSLNGATAADVVIEAFGCGVPNEYVGAMMAAERRSIWIVLEYLSAEPWVESHHALPSPHPQWPLARYFFFPGFTSRTGGLLREQDLFVRRDNYDIGKRAAFWRSVGHNPLPSDVTAVSLFAYTSAPIEALLRVWIDGARPTVVAIPEGPLVDLALTHVAGPADRTQRVVRRGSLEIRIVPFLPQERYDELLWACDCNFVRGEDSFVRAQWAARPFVWHVYPQEGEAHRRKLEAFLTLYGEALPTPAHTAATEMMMFWNQLGAGGVTAAAAWEAYADELQTLRAHGSVWAGRIAAGGDLAAKLARFCDEKLK